MTSTTMSARLDNGSSHQSSSTTVASSGNSTDTRQMVLEHITTVVHTFTVGFAALVIYLVFAHEFAFFQWHPLLLSIGWVLLMTEAILVITKVNVFSKQLTHAVKVRYHWTIQFVAVALSVAGFVIVIISKNRGGRSHFYTNHGIFGLLGIIFSVLSCLNGIATLYHKDLRVYVKPNLNKLIHIACGSLAFLFGGISLAFVVYTSHWFEERTNEPVRIFSSVMLIVSTVWTLIRPILNTIDRTKNLVAR